MLGLVRTSISCSSICSSYSCMSSSTRISYLKERSVHLKSKKLVYEYTSEPPDDLKCGICRGVARKPRQHEKCGKLFCKKCYRLDGLGKGKACPSCRKKDCCYHVDKKSKKAIQALPVKCNNFVRSCTWKGTVGTLEKHLKTCKFSPYPCPFWCRDENGKKFNLFLKEDLKKHKKECQRRPHRCPHCKKRDTFRNITRFHDRVCPLKKIPCPILGCPMMVERDYLAKHMYCDCKDVEVDCKYKTIGCAEMVLRRDQKEHEKNCNLHILLAIDATVALKKENDQLKEDIEFLRSDLMKLREVLLSLDCEQNEVEANVDEEPNCGEPQKDKK